MSKIKIAWVIIAVLAVIGIGTIVLIANPAAPAQWQQPGVEVEDCDAEDWAHYEAECHRPSPAAKTTAPKATAKPRATRR